MAMPQYVTIQNQSNGEYRTDRATHLSKDFKADTCRFELALMSDGYSYSIQSTKTGEYFDDTIQSMTDSNASDGAHWYFFQTGPTTYYIQNVKNNEFMTSRAGELVKNAGADQVWIVKSN